MHEAGMLTYVTTCTPLLEQHVNYRGMKNPSIEEGVALSYSMYLHTKQSPSLPHVRLVTLSFEPKFLVNGASHISSSFSIIFFFKI